MDGNADGWVVIGTKLDTKQLEKDLSNEQRRLQQFEKEAEKLTEKKAKIELDLQDYEREKEAIRKSTDERLKFAQTEEQVNWVLDEEKMQLEQLNQEYSKQLQEIETINSKIQENAKNQSLVKNEIQETTKKLEQSKNFNDINSGINNIGNSIKNVTKKVVGWGLAFLGVRSIVNLVKQSMSTLSQYNEQMASNIEYIRYALANTLAPIIQWLINLVVKLLTYINYIAQAWFGINLFANSSAKAFKNAKDSLGKSAKSAKEINKQLAGFDEMNILQDNTSSGSDAGGGATLPSFDLSGLQGDVPDWLKWIADNKDLILAVMAGVAAGLLAWKLGLTELQSLGIGVAIAGIVYAIQGLIEYLKNPSFKNFGKIIQGIGVAVIGLGIAFLGLPGIIAGAIILIVGTIIKYWEQIQAFLQKGIDWLKGRSDWVHEHFGDTIGNIYDYIVRALQRVLDWFDLTFSSIKKIFDGIIQFVKGVFTGDWKMAWEGIKKIFGGIWDWIKGTANLILTGLIDKAKTIASTVGNAISSVFKAVVNGVLKAIENILNFPIRSINALIGVINKVPGINLGTLPTFNLPRLAKGGIINMPGKGVPVGSAIGGERGQEGVIPLTDSQQMALLGEAIGKYVTINATIPVYAYNRQVDRQIKRIKAEDEFATNS